MERRRQTDAVRNRVSAASLNILDHYAETTGRKMSDLLQVGDRQKRVTRGGVGFVQGRTGIGALGKGRQFGRKLQRSLALGLARCRGGTRRVLTHSTREGVVHHVV